MRTSVDQPPAVASMVSQRIVDGRVRSVGSRRGHEGADLPIADFERERTSHLVGIEADSIFDSALPPSGWAHRHTFYEIAYITGGRGEHVLDCYSYPLRPPSLYFLRPDQVHSWCYRSLPTGYVLAFSEEFLLSQPHRDDVARDAELFHDLADAAQLCVSPQQAREILSIVKEIVHEDHAGQCDYRSVMQAYLHVLLVRAHRMLPAGGVDGVTANRSGRLVREFTELVTQRVGPGQTVREYSHRLGVTPSHLAETVKEATGRTPGQIIRGAQTVEAKRLLVHTDKNVAQIAYELGFKDTAYFGRFFKREAGVPPGEFRRQSRAAASA